ncbi:MAG TPA: hypothetical protein VN625_02385, partial [Desulfuromonadaceae bacterium]|nr:hypothetical protein [Desulfuromonadaceae bacterium]
LILIVILKFEDEDENDDEDDNKSQSDKHLLFVICDQPAFAFGDNMVSFLSQAPGNIFNSPGIFRVDLAAGPERAPVRGDAFGAGGFGFGCGMRGDPGKNSRGNGTSEVGPMFPGEGGSQLVNGDDAAFGDAFHQGIDFTRSGDDESAPAEALAEFAADFADPGQAFVIGEFFAPRFFHIILILLLVLILVFD